MRPDTSMHRRTLLKAFSWEAISLVLTFLLAWLVFGQVAVCVGFAVGSFFIKAILLYVHDRIWHQIPYGKRYHNEHKESKEETEE